MPMTRTTISFTREGMGLIRQAGKRQGSSVSQFVREAGLMRAAMAADDNPYPMRGARRATPGDRRAGIRASGEGDQGCGAGGRSEAVTSDVAARIRLRRQAGACTLSRHL